MLNFKTYLKEDTNKQKWLSRWEQACTGSLEKYAREMRNYDIQNNGDIIFQGNLYILDGEFLDENNEIPIQVKECRRFQISATNIISFKNCPKELSGSSQQFGDYIFSLRAIFGNKSQFNNIRSLEGITPSINGDINLADAPNLSYANADKYFKHIGGALKINRFYKGPLLSFLKIENFEKIYCSYEDENEPTRRACDIVTEHLKGDRNILKCQKELIQNGLKDFAKL